MSLQYHLENLIGYIVAPSVGLTYFVIGSQNIEKVSSLKQCCKQFVLQTMYYCSTRHMVIHTFVNLLL